ncbi:hypothetical protein [Paenibacillus solanacearum]|uniref:hypothetical protein n=1 Tax=Paenibacillus solanacearum TaxID=2048548 RepID=UPI001C401571|nr:hypothetical protein [Paenibacillus solanacearum]
MKRKALLPFQKKLDIIEIAHLLSIDPNVIVKHVFTRTADEQETETLIKITGA